jgi:hypothetical protein
MTLPIDASRQTEAKRRFSINVAFRFCLPAGQAGRGTDCVSLRTIIHSMIKRRNKMLTNRTSLQNVVSNPTQACHLGAPSLTINGATLEPYQIRKLVKRATRLMPVNLAFQVDAVMAGHDEPISLTAQQKLLEAIGEIVKSAEKFAEVVN